MENKQDFKYVLQDTGHIYFGKELTYDEMMEREDIPFKFKAIIGSYFSKDISTSEKLTDHVLTATPDSFSYKIFVQLKMEIKYFYKEETKNIFGKNKTKWVHGTCKVQNIETIKQDLLNNAMTIEEIAISKLALMAISI